MRACDYNVYRFTYLNKEAVRRDTCGGMDSEFSHYETKERTYLCVAPDNNLAQALFYQRSKNKTNLTLTKTEHLGQLDDMLYLQ